MHDMVNTMSATRCTLITCLGKRNGFVKHWSARMVYPDLQPLPDLEVTPSQ